MNINSTLKPDLQAAYDRLTVDLNGIARTPKGAACFPGDDDEVQTLLHQAAARCGAGIGAAVKREKRRLLLVNLVNAHQADGLDITPAVAQGTARRVLGRGLSARMTAKLFATPGRTAANKSNVRADDLAQLETQLVDELAPLLEEIEAAKREANAKWHSSEGRSDVLADWAEQRREQLREEFKFNKAFMSS